MRFRKKTVKLSKYRMGVRSANRDLKEAVAKNGWTRERAKRYAREGHERYDGKQYRKRAQSGAKASDYDRGKAMAYGMFGHTGKFLK